MSGTVRAGDILGESRMTRARARSRRRGVRFDDGAWKQRHRARRVDGCVRQTKGEDVRDVASTDDCEFGERGDAVDDGDDVADEAKRRRRDGDGDGARRKRLNRVPGDVPRDGGERWKRHVDVVCERKTRGIKVQTTWRAGTDGDL